MVLLIINVQNKKIFYVVKICILLMYIKSAWFKLKNWDAQDRLGLQPSKFGKFQLEHITSMYYRYFNRNLVRREAMKQFGINPFSNIKIIHTFCSDYIYKILFLFTKVQNQRILATKPLRSYPGPFNELIKYLMGFIYELCHFCASNRFLNCLQLA